MHSAQQGPPLLQSRAYETTTFNTLSTGWLIRSNQPSMLTGESIPGSQSSACPFLLRGRSGSQCQRDPLRQSWVLGNCFGTALSCSSRPEGRYPTSATPSTLGRSSG